MGCPGAEPFAKREGAMASVLIVYYSRSGNTEKMARSVGDGVSSVKGAKLAVKKVAETTTKDLLEADAIIMGSPVYYGTMAAELKELIDESVKVHRQACGGKSGGRSRLPGQSTAGTRRRCWIS